MLVLWKYVLGNKIPTTTSSNLIVCGTLNRDFHEGNRLYRQQNYIFHCPLRSWNIKKFYEHVIKKKKKNFLEFCEFYAIIYTPMLLAKSNFYKLWKTAIVARKIQILPRCVAAMAILKREIADRT